MKSSASPAAKAGKAPVATRAPKSAKVPKKSAKKVSAAQTAIENLDHSKLVKELIATGKEKNFLTIDEINDALPTGDITPEQMDDIFLVFSEMNIEVVDGPAPVSTAKAPAPASEEETEELDLDPSVDTRTDDPVRMYLREMGYIKLLSREEEVEISKRIEEGQREMISVLSRSSLVARYLLILGAKLQAGKIKVQEIISGMDEDDNVIEEEGLAVVKVLKSLDKARTAWNKLEAIKIKKRPKVADKAQVVKLRKTLAEAIK